MLPTGLKAAPAVPTAGPEPEVGSQHPWRKSLTTGRSQKPSGSRISRGGAVCRVLPGPKGVKFKNCEKPFAGSSQMHGAEVAHDASSHQEEITDAYADIKKNVTTIRYRGRLAQKHFGLSSIARAINCSKYR